MTVWVDGDVPAGQNLNDAAGLTLSTSSALSVVGAASWVRVEINVHGAIADTANAQRPAPVCELYRTSLGQVHLASAATGYIRDTTDHEESSFNLVFTDLAPGSNPAYEVRFRRDSTNGNAVNTVSPSSVKLEAVY